MNGSEKGNKHVGICEQSNNKQRYSDKKAGYIDDELTFKRKWCLVSVSITQ